ncbi:MAG: L-threonine 3-dehydrogenase [Ardenticatenaceae bacterium]|nr:L-threonine 3-dehydrogenase [Ardenticatenaceae bacterium]HBY94925.1 L-threonine 3-dehydrogenase [Chloroflexota bacterium]
MPTKMHAVMKTEAGPGLAWVETDIPTVGPDDVLVQVRATSICGTDLHIRRWDTWASGRVHPPLIVGHEMCGEVVAIGERVSTVAVGDFVSAESHIVCGICDQCSTGNAHICRNTKILGVDTDGVFAEYACIPAANAWKNPLDMPWELAALQENFGNAVHTVMAADTRARRVLVTGCGPVGLMAIAVVCALGARVVIATDISEYRLDLARRLGADLALNPSRDDVQAAVLDRTAGGGVDVLLEFSGAAPAIRQGLHALRDGGEAALLGIPHHPIELDWANDVVFKGITLRGIVGRRLWQTWHTVRDLLEGGLVDLSPVVTHRFALADFDQAMDTMASGKSGKVVMFPQGVPAAVETGAAAMTVLGR